MQPDTGHMHHQEGRTQHQRNRQCHHHTRAHAQGEKAHGEHNHDGFEQCVDELTDDARNRRRLIRDPRQVHAERHFAVELREGLIEAFPEPDDVAAPGHGNRDADRRLPVEAHLWRRRILIAALDGGDITQLETTALPANGQLTQLLDAIEATGHPQIDPVFFCIDGTGGYYGVLRSQRLRDQLRRDAELIALGVGDIQVDTFFLQADELDLGDIGDPQQSFTDAVGIVLQFLIAEFGTRQRIDVAEGVAKFIVESGSDDTGRQSVAHITDFFAHLVETIRHRSRWQILAKQDEHLGLAGP